MTTPTPKTVAPTVEQVMAQADVLCQFYECHGVEDTLRYTAEHKELQSLVEALAVDAERYRWLRDKSEPGICAFYLSVGKAFYNIKFKPETVDTAIDAARTSPTTQGAVDMMGSEENKS